MDHLPKLGAGDLIRMTAKQLRQLDVNDLRALMHQLGLNIEGIKEANQGLTRLFENALSIEDIA